MEKAKILIIEDEQRLADVIAKQLQEKGFATEVAWDGYIGRQLVMHQHYSLIILDVNIPVINGYDLCREIRKINSGVPVIMLTALGATDQKIEGFDAGADDYLVKPFDFRELLARINVFLRRSESAPNTETLTIADLVMNLSDKTVYRAQQKIELTNKEFALLEEFLKNKGKLLSREQIIENVWGIDFDPGTNIIDVYINYLRKKIDRDFEPKLIHTRFGKGFYCSETEG